MHQRWHRLSQLVIENNRWHRQLSIRILGVHMRRAIQEVHHLYGRIGVSEHPADCQSVFRICDMNVDVDSFTSVT